MSYQSDGDPVLEYDIKLTAKASSELDDYIQKLEKMEAKKEAEKKKRLEEKKKKEEEKKKKEEEKEPDFLEQIQKLSPDKLAKVRASLSIQGAAQTIGGGVADQLIGQAGKGGKLGALGGLLAKSSAFIAPLALAVGTVVVSKMVIEILSKKGGPLNRDWRRFVAQEVDVGLSRRTAKEKELGITQLILTQTAGWKPNNASWTYNSLFDVNSSRLARAGLEDRAAGVISKVV